MTSTFEEDNGVGVLSLDGRIDTRTSAEFEREVMSRIVGPEAVNRLVADFSDLDYINSTGMRVLLLLAKRLGASGGKLVLCSMKMEILEVFRISGFNQIITITNDRAEAIAAVSE